MPMSPPVPRLSVVMPTLNQREFIGAAIQSVFEQRDVDLELIVMDGGSTDETHGLLTKIGAQFGERLRWCSRADSGPPQAVNRAIGHARSNVIGWLNSDDLYAPGAAANALAVLDGADGVAMVYGKAQHIDIDGRTIGPYPTRAADTPIEEFAHGCFICQPTVFFRKDVFFTLGG